MDVKNLFTFLIVSLFVVSLLSAAAGDASLSSAKIDAVQGGGQGTGNGSQVDTETQNMGEATNLKISVQSGNYEGSNGEQMQIQIENGFKLKVGDSEAKSGLEIKQQTN